MGLFLRKSLLNAELFCSKQLLERHIIAGSSLEEKNLITRFRGELNHHTSEIFRKTVDKELAKTIRVQNLILNMANLTFMDSSGIGAILGRINRLEPGEGHNLRVKNP